MLLTNATVLLVWGLGFFLTRSSVKCGADDTDSILEIKGFAVIFI